MRPRLFTPVKIAIGALAIILAACMVYWLSIGAPLPGSGIPSTAGKVVFVSDRDGHKHLWMADAASGADAVALTNGNADDTEPTWRGDGAEIAFIAQNRAGITPQAFTVDAAPGANPVPLSNTSATKSQPRYGAANRVYYLAAGKVIATDPATRDTDQLFPAFDAAKTAAPLLASGGIVAVQPAPDGKRLIMTMQMEKGQALLMYDIDNEACVLLGAASERVLFKFFPDGKLFTLFVGGAPLTKPVLLFGHDQISAGLPAMGPLLISAESDEQITLQVGEGNDPAATPRLRLPKANVAVQLSTAGAVAMEPIPVPFQPTSIALSPDGSLVVFGVEMPSLTPQGTLPPGLFVMSTTNKPAPGGKPILFTNPAREPSFSPDGKQIVFTSEKDIYVVPADGSAEAKPLTKGQGNSNQPAWSPAVVKK